VPILDVIETARRLRGSSPKSCEKRPRVAQSPLKGGDLGRCRKLSGGHRAALRHTGGSCARAPVLVA
jgi:hypothetical protein